MLSASVFEEPTQHLIFLALLRRLHRRTHHREDYYHDSAHVAGSMRGCSDHMGHCINEPQERHVPGTGC